LVLQARGHQVTALDLIPEAVRIMRERGVEDVREGTLFELPAAILYDTVILLMNGSMIAETLSGLDRLLAAAAKVLEPQGALILDSTDLRDAVDWDGDEGFEDDDRYIGELHYQLSVGEHVGDIFPQLFVDPDTLDTRARLAGWNTEVIWSGPGGRYLARLVSVTDDGAGQDRVVSETLA
jgi:SAM-dependent methyltransferase